MQYNQLCPFLLFHNANYTRDPSIHLPAV